MTKLTDGGITAKLKTAFPTHGLTGLRVYQTGANNDQQEISITLTEIKKVKNGKKVARNKGK